MEDLTLKCVEKDCGKEFLFPVHEQQFFEKNGFTAPHRCRACREKRRRAKEDKRAVDEPTEKKDLDEALRENNW